MYVINVGAKPNGFMKLKMLDIRGIEESDINGIMNKREQIMKIKISCVRWSIPDYKRGETEEDSHLKKLEIESDTLHTQRFSVDLEDEEVITWLKIVQNVVRASIKSEEERLNKRS